MKKFLFLLTLLFGAQSFAADKTYDIQIDTYKNGKFRTSRKIKTLENLSAKVSQENHFGYKTYSEVIPQKLADGRTLLKFESGEILPDDNFVIKEDIIFKETDFFQTVKLRTKNNHYEYIVRLL